VNALDFKIYIFPLLFFKRISDIEYQAALKESGGDTMHASLSEMHRFEISAGCHWKDVRETTTNVEKIIEGNLPAVEEALADLKTAWCESLKAEERFKTILARFMG